jgi:hypothetical protein
MALRDLLDRPADDPELLAARRLAHQTGPVAAILDEMEPDGYWVEPGAGYYPKYRGTVWSLIMLAQLGAAADEDARIGRACAYVLDHGLTADGRFSVGGNPSGNIDCLHGNLLCALLDLGWIRDARIPLAFEWAARSVTGEGVAPKEDRSGAARYYAGNCGPGFRCGANDGLPCAWGAVKIMLAFSKLPHDQRTPLIERAIQQGADFLLDGNPVLAEYPNGYSDKPSGNWWKFGFPVFYVTDMLQNVEALVNLGYAHDERLKPALDWIADHAPPDGRWPLAYHYSGKTWVDVEQKKQPSKWVTLRVLRVLKAAREGKNA